MKMRLQLTRHQAVLRVMTLALPLIVSSGTANAQDPVNCTGSNGNSKVAVPTTICSSGVAGSMAYVDAAAFTSKGTDMCTTINGILTGSTYSNLPTAGVVVDARGLNVANAASDSTFSSALACASDPYNTPYGKVTVPSVLLLPPGGIATSTTWIMPSNSRLLGVFPVLPGTTETAIQPSASFSPSGAPPAGVNGVWYDFPTLSLIQMCATTGCSGISIEHLVLDGGGELPTPQQFNGIYNSGAGDQSYVNDVTINNTAYNAMFIGTSAGASGPYSNINVNISLYGNGDLCGATGTTAQQCPACVVMLASTRGLHGLTCIGNSSTAAQPTGGAYNQAGVYIVGSNNSVKDVHTESFWDGVQLFAGNGAMSNIHVSNVAGAATVNNTAHICGRNANPALFGGCYKYPFAKLQGHTIFPSVHQRFESRSHKGPFNV